MHHLLLRIVTILFLLCHYMESTGQLTPNAIDSLENLLENEPSTKNQIDLMNQLSVQYYRVSVYKEQEYAYKAYKLSKDTGYKRGEAQALKNIGIVQRTIGAPLDSILHYYNQSLVIAEQEDFLEIKIALLNNIGLSLGEYAQYQRALNYLLKSIDLDEEHMPMSWKRTMILANIGGLYYKLEDYNKALFYFNKSHDLADEHGYDFINLMHIDDIATTKYKLGEKENAQNIIINSLEEIRAEGDYESLYQSMLALIDIWLEEDKLTSSKDLAFKMLEELEIHNLPIYRCQLYSRLSDLEYRLKHHDHALEYGNKSLDCADQKTSNIILTEALKRMYKVYDFYNDTEMKDSIHNRYVVAAEKEFDRKVDIAVGEEEFKYENLLKEREIELLKEKQKASERLTRFLIGGVCSFLLLSLFTGYLFIRKNKFANILALKNKALKQTEQSLADKNKMLEKYIESNIQLSQFAHIASHDLKAPLRTVSSFIGLAKNSGKDRLSTSENEYLDLSLKATKDMYQLVEDLLSYSKVNALELQIEEIEMSALIEEIETHLNYSIREKGAKINSDCSIQKIYGDKTKLRQVFENLLSNAIKFVPNDRTPQIDLTCEDRGEYWLFNIADNGIGIDPNYVSLVFEPFKQLNSKDEFSGTGLGLALCREIVEKHHGKIWIESLVGKGTNVYFTINKYLSSMTA